MRRALSSRAAKVSGTRIAAFLRADGVQLLRYQNAMLQLGATGAAADARPPPALLLVLPLASRRRCLLGLATTENGAAFDLFDEVLPLRRRRSLPHVYKTSAATVVAMPEAWEDFGLFRAAFEPYGLAPDVAMHGQLVRYYAHTVSAALAAQGFRRSIRWGAVAFQPTSPQARGRLRGLPPAAGRGAFADAGRARQRPHSVVAFVEPPRRRRRRGPSDDAARLVASGGGRKA